MTALIVAPAVLGILTGWYFGWKAIANLSDFGFQNHTRVFWALGAFGKPEYFTLEGWRYRRWGFLASTGGAVLSLCLGLLFW